MRKLARRLKRRTQQERLGERRPEKRNDWLKMFPREIKRAKVLARAQLKIQEKILEQSEAQLIGRLREEKVFKALQFLKERGEIRDYLWPGKLSYSDLIEGVDFIFIYVNGCYKVCRFSVTGWRWIKQHKEKHPEIPVLSVNLEESRESIEQKILCLKNGNGNYFRR